MMVTVVLAAFTRWLAFETRRLRADSARSIDAALKSAEAAEKSIILSNRPRLIVRHVLTEGDPIESQHRIVTNEIESKIRIEGTFQIFNSGITLASNVSVAYKVCVLDKLPMSVTFDKSESLNSALAPGVFKIFVFRGELPIGNPEWMGYRNKSEHSRESAGGYDLYVLGEITYSDDLHNQRVTRFCRRLDRKVTRFFPVEDSEYESAD